MAAEAQPPTEEASASAPPPPSPPTSPPVTGNNQKSAPPVDGRLYYGYLFNKDKTTTRLLRALLIAIGKYIGDKLGDKNHRHLDRTKLAAFYKAVGGDYDALFVAAPDKSISYIWQALGVQHILLQPSGNDYAEPTIPALTLGGFVRWESLQILLGPEEHVPFLQFAVRNWALRHPDTGEIFPADLPAEAFPAVCDPQIDDWHRQCAKRLRTEAAPTTTSETQSPQANTQDPRVHFSHVRPSGPQRQGPAMDYFDRARNNVPFIHIPSRHGGPETQKNQSTYKRRMNSDSSSSADERAHRRRSFSDVPSPSAHSPARGSGRSPGGHLNPRRPVPPMRRHSHAHPESDSESDSGASPHGRAHRPVRPPTASVRVFPPHESHAPAATQVPPRSNYRAELRTDDRDRDPRRRSLPSGTFSVRDKLGSLLGKSRDRTRSNSRSSRETDSRPTSSRLRPEPHTSSSSHPSRRGRTDEVVSSAESDSDVSPHHRGRRDLERERDQKRREREQRERELEEERERRSRKDRAAHLRPDMSRRTSSAAEVERRPREWDVRDRHRDRDRDRDRDRVRDRDVRDPTRNVTSDERDRRGWRDRGRDGERDGKRGASPVVVGVTGRKYPAEAMKPTWA